MMGHALGVLTHSWAFFFFSFLLVFFFILESLQHTLAASQGDGIWEPLGMPCQAHKGSWQFLYLEML